jgi:hypothetical protein
MRVKLVISVVLTLTAALATAGAATALPLSQSQPFEAVCEAQGGIFNAPATDPTIIDCTKFGGGYLTAFTPNQLAVQRTLCEQVYQGTFGVIGHSDPFDTITICSTA